MTDLEKLRSWIQTYPGQEALAGYRIDMLDQIPLQGSIAPSGLVEISRREDILGNLRVENQYNFGIYYVFQKDSQDDAGATENARWVMDFQNWVQKQSALHLTPTFGDEPRTERMTAQNGSIYAADEEGTAIYMVQLSASFTKIYEE